MMIKLHLGCGAHYLPGYINIDFQQNFTVQHRDTKPDFEADFRKIDLLQWGPVEKIKCHHVLEHFQRWEALALLAHWCDILEDGGVLDLRVPDIDACIQAYSETNNYILRQNILRHMYGSHEAMWATHHDGWTKARFRYLLPGFDVLFEEHETYHVWYEIRMRAIKTNHYSWEGHRNIAKQHLQCCVYSDKETELMNGWVAAYEDMADMLTGRHHA